MWRARRAVQAAPKGQPVHTLITQVMKFLFFSFFIHMLYYTILTKI
jgi:hypothetical protein